MDQEDWILSLPLHFKFRLTHTDNAPDNIQQFEKKDQLLRMLGTFEQLEES